MKKIKIISVALLAFMVIPLFAQENEAQANKTASDFLPVAGEYSIGINANPILNFLGNAFNGHDARNTIGDLGGQALLEPPLGTMPNAFPLISIMGKYMMTDNFALRANVGLILNRKNDNVYVLDDQALALDPLSFAKVIDSRRVANNGGSFSFGGEYRVGKRKVQGIFGASALYAFSLTSTTYKYGNAITEVNQAPTTNGVITPGVYPFALSSAYPNARTIEDFSTTGNHTLGLVGSVGVEWFVAPKIALGCEVNLALLYGWTPNLYSKIEGYNTLSLKVDEFTELIAPRSSEFIFGTQNIGANLFVNFYF